MDLSAAWDPLSVFLAAAEGAPAEEEREVAPFNWQALIDHSVHEVKIWSPKRHSFGTVAYHLKALSDLDLIMATDERAARGARESYYLPT